MYNGYYRLMRATHVFTRDGQGEYMEIVGEFEFTRKQALSEDERKQIEYDVYRTAQVTEEGKQEAASKADEKAQESPSYNQSENNQVAEGKREASPTAQTGSSAPTSVSDTTNSASTSKSQPFNPSTDQGYQKQEAAKNNNGNKLTGSPAPRPLNESPMGGRDSTDSFILH